MPEYRERLFNDYHAHVGAMDPSDAAKAEWFGRWVDAHYVPRLAGLDPATARVLEVGCNRGYMLEALRARGYRDLTGVDLSPNDVAAARARVPGVRFECQDAAAFLPANGPYDLILLKAVLEHVPKDGVLPLLRLLAGGLRPGGRLLVEVPNMDWLFAGHERYMDFTHECGFTAESLRQVMGQAGGAVEVVALDHLAGHGGLARARARAARAVLGGLLRWADPEGGSAPVWSRSLLGVLRRPA